MPLNLSTKQLFLVLQQEHEVKNQEQEQEIEKLKSNLESLQEQLQEVCIDPLNDVTTSKCRHNHKCKHKHKDQTFSFNCTCNQVVGSAHHPSLSHRTPTCMLARMLTCNTSENKVCLPFVQKTRVAHAGSNSFFFFFLV